MLKITCPICGLDADETEFQPGGEAHLVRPASASPGSVSDEAQMSYLYVRQNPRGLAHELWLCARGCGKWFHASRDTVTMEFKRFYRISEPEAASARSAAKPARRRKAAPRLPGTQGATTTPIDAQPMAERQPAADQAPSPSASPSEAPSEAPVPNASAPEAPSPKSPRGKPAKAGKAPARRKADKT